MNRNPRNAPCLAAYPCTLVYLSGDSISAKQSTPKKNPLFFDFMWRNRDSNSEHKIMSLVSCLYSIALLCGKDTTLFGTAQPENTFFINIYSLWIPRFAGIFFGTAFAPQRKTSNMCRRGIEI
jgi:hypothetical protein